jgi:hypothetical protein
MRSIVIWGQGHMTLAVARGWGYPQGVGVREGKDEEMYRGKRPNQQQECLHEIDDQCL